jgi:hypothetical protein
VNNVTYWFRPTDDHREPFVEWLRQTGAAIAAAASAISWDDGAFSRRPWVEVSVGTVQRHPTIPRAVTTEGVSFCAEDLGTIGRIESVLRHLGASRSVAVIREDPVARESLAPFAFLHGRALLRFGWWGPENEDALRNFTGLRAFCASDHEEDARLLTLFGRADSANALAAFHAHAIARAVRLA